MNDVDITSFFSENYPIIYFFLARYTKKIPDNVPSDSLELAKGYFADLSNLDVDAFEKLVVKKYFPDEDVAERLKSDIKKAIPVVEKLINDISRDESLENYRKESINQTLRQEFSNQIQPIMYDVSESRISLFENDRVAFDIIIHNNDVDKKSTIVSFDVSIKKVFLIDNPFIIDGMNSNSERIIMFSRGRNYEDDSFLDNHRIISHEKRLSNTLKRRQEISIFEETIVSPEIDNVKSIINTALPGFVESDDDGSFLVNKEKKLSLSNLATGSKLFLILKILIEKNQLDKETLLILDEPESHLHPEWENIFAQIVVLLAKEVGVKILLTTHSSNFMLAIDAYTKKLDYLENTNFYKTERQSDDSVSYKLLNDNLEEIYDDFFEYFSEMKRLRDENSYL